MEISVRRGATGGFTPLLSNRFPIEPENGVEHALRDNIEYKKKKNNKNDETREICSRTLHPLIALQRIVVHRIIKLRRVILRNLDRWWKIEATTRIESASIAAIAFFTDFILSLFFLFTLSSRRIRDSFDRSISGKESLVAERWRALKVVGEEKEGRKSERGEC